MDLVEGFKTALGLQKSASQKAISNFIRKHPKVIFNRAAPHVQLSRYRVAMDSTLGRLKTSLDDETQSTNQEKGKQKRSFCSEKPLQATLEHRTDDSQKIKVLQYQMNNAVANEHWVQNGRVSLASIVFRSSKCC